MYLTYDDYQNMGGTLDETTFESLEFEASAYIDYVTFNRLENETVIPEKVQRCVYYIIGLLEQKLNAMQSVPVNGGNSQGGGLGITSQSNDGVSVSYNVMSAKDVLTSCQDEIENAVKTYLQGVTNTLGRKLLYRGLYPGE